MRSTEGCSETTSSTRRARYLRSLCSVLALLFCVWVFPRAASLSAAPMVEEGIDYLLVFDRCYASKGDVKRAAGRLRKGLKKLAGEDRVAVVAFDCRTLEGALSWSSSRADTKVALQQVAKSKPRKSKAIERVVPWVRFSEAGEEIPFFPVGAAKSATPLVRLSLELERAIRALAEPNRRQTAILVAGSLPAGGILIPENYAQVLAGEAPAQGLRTDLWQPLVDTARELKFSLHSLSSRQVRVVYLASLQATSSPVGVDQEAPPDQYGGVRIAPESERNSPEGALASSTDKNPGNGSPVQATRRSNEPPELHPPQMRLAAGSAISIGEILSQVVLQERLLRFLSMGSAGLFHKQEDLPDLWHAVARYEHQRFPPEEDSHSAPWARFLAALLVDEPTGGELEIEIRQVDGEPVRVALKLPRGLVSTDSSAETFGERLEVYLATSGDQDSLAVFPGAAITIQGKFAPTEQTVNLPLWLGLPATARRLAIAVRNSRGEYSFGTAELNSGPSR